MNPVLVFVYGTLRSGEGNHYFLNSSRCVADHAWVYGELYDTGVV
ncbi:gamma-glutamylcyclotransferase [Alkalihalobacillus hemicellulosilyticus]|nr:gamma-glutamylcyclotransferase [Halalkalibacter hemicellulosilyticus]